MIGGGNMKPESTMLILLLCRPWNGVGDDVEPEDMGGMPGMKMIAFVV